MPELPEVETVVRELREEICGDIISSVEIFRNNPIVQGDLDTFQEQLWEENLWMLGAGPNI